jgi:hypothetical protein
MDSIAIIVTIALVLGPLLAYRHHRRVSAAAATAIAKMPLQPIVAHCSRLAMLPILLCSLVGSSVFLIFALDKHVPSDVQPQGYQVWRSCPVWHRLSRLVLSFPVSCRR